MTNKTIGKSKEESYNLFISVDKSNNNLLSTAFRISCRKHFLMHTFVCFLLFTDGFGEPAKGVCAVGRNPLFLGAEVDGCAGCPSYSAGEWSRMQEVE